jgi:transcriptional repressor NrdR
MVIKKDGSREPFERKKVVDGILKACEKRPISMDDIEGFVDSLEKEIRNKGVMEVESSFVGEKVMEKLKEWDDVAYVRFASVYKQFKDLGQFMNQLQVLLKEEKS